ncbi:ATP-dependent sacrificial sulfur transferase LarE, partial [Bacteroidota bacterium]
LDANAISVTVKSPYHFSAEVKDAETFAKEIGSMHETVDFEIADEIRENPKDRCYLCKKKIFATLVQKAKDRKINFIVEGSNTDDNKVYRPGLKALEELGVRSPLMEAGLTKNDVRELAKDFNLKIWDKASNSCLLTRLPYGTTIDEKVLRKIEKGEEFLLSLGFDKVRIRTYDDFARIEIDENQIERILKQEVRSKITSRLKEIGYKFICLDLEGFRSGSFDK